MRLTDFDITVLFILAVIGVIAFIVGIQAFGAWLRWKWDRRQAIKRGEEVGDDMDFFTFFSMLDFAGDPDDNNDFF